MTRALEPALGRTRRPSPAVRAGGATGPRVPHRQPWGRYHPAREASVEPPWDPRSLTLLGSLGCLAAPACGDLCPAAMLWLPAASGCPDIGVHTLSPQGGRCTQAPLLAPRRQRSQRASWISSHPGSPSRRRSLPRETADGPIHAPSQAATRAWCHRRKGAGISVSRNCARRADLPLPARGERAGVRGGHMLQRLGRIALAGPNRLEHLSWLGCIHSYIKALRPSTKLSAIEPLEDRVSLNDWRVTIERQQRAR